MNVITGGYMPEYGRSTGGVLNAVTKSGSNEFHGSVFGNFTPGAFAGRADGEQRERQHGHHLGDQRPLEHRRLRRDLGGPIIKDKLWFYAGVAPSFQRYRWTRSFKPPRWTVEATSSPTAATGQVVYAPIPDSAQRRFSDREVTQLHRQADLPRQLGPPPEPSVTGTPTTGGGGASFPTRLPGGLQARTASTRRWCTAARPSTGSGTSQTNDSCVQRGG